VKFVLATGNPDKVRELRRLFGSSGIELEGLPFDAPRPDETGSTLIENARIKARAACDRTGLPAIADDTGLEVDALDGRPGVHAARYSGPHATYADNVAKLLAELEGVPAPRRTARFRTVCIACLPDGREVAAEGVLEGTIAATSRGRNGFGYDPVFVVAGTDRTLAECTEDEKNRLSHRAMAARALASRLRPGPR
jgi:XTP/dITP diphosphohydrolase